MIQFVKLTPGYFFTYARDPRKIINEMDTFNNKDVRFESLKSSHNKYGTIRFRRFGFENVACVVFKQIWGDASEGEGNREFSGYYYADPGQGLTDEVVEAVVKGIGPRIPRGKKIFGRAGQAAPPEKAGPMGMRRWPGRRLR